MTRPDGQLLNPDAPGVLVTGAAGEVGHAILRGLAAGGAQQVVATDLRSVPLDGAFCVQGDLLDPNLVESLFTGRIGLVIHLAALLSSAGEQHPDLAWRINADATWNLMRQAMSHAEAHGHTVRFVYPSSIAVHGRNASQSHPLLEDEAIAPRTLYGVTKRAMEQAGTWLSEECGRMLGQETGATFDFRTIRYPGLLSAETLPTGGTSDYAPEMVHAAVRGEKASCFVPPHAQLPFMTMPEAAEATLALASAPRSCLQQNVYAVGGFAPTVAELENALRDRFPNFEVDYDPHPFRSEIVDSWPADVDDSAAQRDWGFERGLDLGSALDDYLIPGIRNAHSQSKYECEETPRTL
jgi:threonine 3-dehydrogenase